MNIQYLIICADGKKKAIISENIDMIDRKKIENELKNFGCEIIKDDNEIKELLKNMFLIAVSKMELELGR